MSRHVSIDIHLWEKKDLELMTKGRSVPVVHVFGGEGSIYFMTKQSAEGLREIAADAIRWWERKEAQEKWDETHPEEKGETK